MADFKPGAQNKPPRRLQDVRRRKGIPPVAAKVEALLLEAPGRTFTEAGTLVAELRGSSFEAVRRHYNTWMRSDPRFLRLPADEFANNKRFLRTALQICREMAGESGFKQTDELVRRMPAGWADRWPHWLIARELDIVRSTCADVWTNIGPNQHWFGNKLQAVSAFLHIANVSKTRAMEMSGVHRSEVESVFRADPSVRALPLLLVLAACGVQVALMDANGALLDLSSEDSCNRVTELAERLGWEVPE